MSLQPDRHHFITSCFHAAALGGTLAMLEYLCHYPEGDYDVDSAKKACLHGAAKHGNLHIIQWFWTRSGLSQDEKNSCLLSASSDGHLHVVKWLHKQGADIRVEGRGDSVSSCAGRLGDVPVLEWFYQQGGDLHQVTENGKSAVLEAIQSDKPQAVIWLFQRGYRLTNRDIDYIFTRRLGPRSGISERLMGVLFKMTSKIRRASLFHSSSLYQKLWILTRLLQLCGENEDLSEEDADARFARFNQYNDKKLQQKCLVALANLIGEQSTTVEAGLNAVDSLSIPSDCKFNLRELVAINLEK